MGFETLPPVAAPAIERRPPRQAAGRRPLLLFVPGVNNSGPAHWQSLWERDLGAARRVKQSDWDEPRLAEWLASLAEEIRAHSPAVIVAHSLGCALVAHLVSVTGGRGIAGAFLVAPADVDQTVGRLAPSFAPMPQVKAPFPTFVLASRNDPFVTFDRARAFANCWGGRLIDRGFAGHVNAQSGHGLWPEGRAFLDELLEAVDPDLGAGRAWTTAGAR
jgi:predicted alpha/beta hydrolase family esterase